MLYSGLLKKKKQSQLPLYVTTYKLIARLKTRLLKMSL